MTTSMKQTVQIGGKTTEAQHTLEPWRYVDQATTDTKAMGLHDYAIESADGEWDIASLIAYEANARRICAAVNACKDISTETLEEDAVKQLLLAIDGLLAFIGHGHDDKPAVYIARAARARVGGENPFTTA